MRKYLLVFLLLSSFLSQAATNSHMRGGRYCEIIVPKTITSYAVYNTWGLNDCPEKIWDQITVERVKAQTKAHFVHLNGPRYWVIDGFKNSKLINSTTEDISGLKLREAGILHIRLIDLVKSQQPYKEHIVDRTTTWVYDAGKPIYELISPKGTVYVMQSFSIQKHPQSLSSLDRLATDLKLPKGWIFKAGIVKKSEALKAINNKAIVVQDDFLNTYQMATHDYL